MEIDAVHVHDVDPPAVKRVLDRQPMRGVGAATHGIGDRPDRPGSGDQGACGAGARAGDHDGSMAGTHQGGIKLSQHLLGAADGVMAHRGEREGDAQNAKCHAGPAARMRTGVFTPPGLE
jgi:hypothetical protein